MKNIFFTALVIVLLASCGSETKQSRLEKLRKERNNINEEITKIESEITKEQSRNTLKAPANIGITEIKTQPFEHYVEVQGKVDGEENIGVSAKTLGIVTDIFVKEGDAVKKGQMLAQLDDQVMQQSLKEVQTQLDFAINLFNKQKNLWEQKIGSEVQYLTAKTNKEAFENRKATLIDQIEMSKIKSPIDGTVEEIPIKIGQSVAPGFPVFRVINFSKIKVIADVAEVFSSNVKTGNDVSIYFPDLAKEVSATLSFASKYINTVNRTFAVSIRIDPDGLEYRANMIAVIKIKDYSSPDAITLPINIIQSDNTSKYIFTVRNNNGKFSAKKQFIKLGLSYNGVVEILDGLKTGEKVISSGYQDLEDGQIITF